MKSHERERERVCAFVCARALGKSSSNDLSSAKEYLLSETPKLSRARKGRTHVIRYV